MRKVITIVAVVVMMLTIAMPALAARIIGPQKMSGTWALSDRSTYCISKVTGEVWDLFYGSNQSTNPNVTLKMQLVSASIQKLGEFTNVPNNLSSSARLNYNGTNYNDVYARSQSSQSAYVLARWWGLTK